MKSKVKDKLVGVYAPGGIGRMQWVVRVARNMDDVKECYFTDKEEALKRMEILKRLSMAVDDATVWMEEVDD